MDGLCKAGCIISIISAVSIMLISIIVVILFSVLNLNFIKFNYDETIKIFNYVISVMIIIADLTQILTLVFCISLLRGKARSQIPAGILSGMFSGWLGGILILVGKYEGKTVVNVISDINKKDSFS